MSNKWHNRFLRLAQEIATWSKDPSTKCGAVIVRPDRTIASLGYNGFPRKMIDSDHLYLDRDQKYSRVIHAEMNAILSHDGSVRGCTLYTWPLGPCERCAVHVVQAGLVLVVCPPTPGQTRQGLRDSVMLGSQYLKECGVEVILAASTTEW